MQIWMWIDVFKDTKTHWPKSTGSLFVGAFVFRTNFLCFVFYFQAVFELDKIQVCVESVSWLYGIQKYISDENNKWGMFIEDLWL